MLVGGIWFCNRHVTRCTYPGWFGSFQGRHLSALCTSMFAAWPCSERALYEFPSEPENELVFRNIQSFLELILMLGSE